MSANVKTIVENERGEWWCEITYDLVNVKDLQVGDTILDDPVESRARFCKITKINKKSIWVHRYIMGGDGILFASPLSEIKMIGTVFSKVVSTTLGDKIVVEPIQPIQTAGRIKPKFLRVLRDRMNEWYYDGADEYQDYLEKNAEKVVELFVAYLSDYVVEESQKTE